MEYRFLCTITEGAGDEPDLIGQRPYGLAEGSEFWPHPSGFDDGGITGLLQDLNTVGIRFSDLSTSQSSLEDIFVDLVRHAS